MLETKTVAYLNVDLALSGKYAKITDHYFTAKLLS